MANNIFQYGQLYAWGREHGRKTMSMRFAYKYPDFKIAHTRYHHFLIYVLAKWAAKLRLIPTIVFDKLDGDITPQLSSIHSHWHVLVTGWCVRFPDLFEKYKEEIIDLFQFTPGIHEKIRHILQQSSQDTIKLGVHIRRGDYRTWCGGRYYFDDSQYLSIIQQFIRMQADKRVDVYICSNDPKINKLQYHQLLTNSNVFFPQGTPAEDLCLLSECDYLIGPPSTFTLVACMYHNTPLYWIADTNHKLTATSFHGFDYQARHFDNYYISIE